MTNLQKVMKYALIYGFIGAVLLPFIHESYANIGKTFALVVLAVLVAAATIRLSMYSFKEAVLGLTVMLAISSILGACLYLIVHEMVVDFLEKNSEYFYLGVTEHFRYYVSAAVILILGYVLCLLIFGFKKLISKFKDNQKKTKDYIDNAFDENFEDENKDKI